MLYAVALTCTYLFHSLPQTLKAWDTVCEMVGDLSEMVRSHDDLYYTWLQSSHGTATMQHVTMHTLTLPECKVCHPNCTFQ